MPPKAKYTREEIADAAYDLVREQGEDALTARSLAVKLKISTAPIFTAFENIEEVHSAVINKAKELYKSYFDEGLKQTPPFKGSGRMYIKFAKDEPMLFKMLFMKGCDKEKPSHYLPSSFEYEPIVREAVSNLYSFEEEKAKRIYNHLSVYVHGLAVLYAQGRCVFTDEDIDRMLSEVFKSLLNGGCLN